MAVSHLVDTSVLTRLGAPSVRAVVEPLAAIGRAARAGISDLEVGYSARNAAEWDELVGALDAFELVETTAEHIQRARHVQRMLAAISQRGRKVPDLLVAAAAEQAGYTVLHYDADFDLIASVTGQPCQWVVPPGTVDWLSHRTRT
jgi:predicted nucleic acid-binding protein